MKLGTVLRRYRAERGLTIKDVSNRVGVPSSTYRDWEYGRKVPAQFISQLAEVLGVSLQALMGQKAEGGDDLTTAIHHLEQALIILRQLPKPEPEVQPESSTAES